MNNYYYLSLIIPVIKDQNSQESKFLLSSEANIYLLLYQAIFPLQLSLSIDRTTGAVSLSFIIVERKLNGFQQLKL